MNADADLMEMRTASGILGCGTRLLDGGHQQRHQQANDRQHSKYLN